MDVGVDSNGGVWLLMASVPGSLWRVGSASFGENVVCGWM